MTQENTPLIRFDIEGIEALVADALEDLRRDPAAGERRIDYVDRKLIRPLLRRCNELREAISRGDGAAIERDACLIFCDAVALGSFVRPSDWRTSKARADRLSQSRAERSERAQEIVDSHVRAYRKTNRARAGSTTIARAIRDAANADLAAAGLSPLGEDALKRRIRNPK